MSSSSIDLSDYEVSRSAQSVAASVGDVLEHVAGGVLRSRRFTVRFWDGSELPATADLADPLTFLVTDPAALAHIAREPNEIGLARAWATGTLDLVGALDGAFDLREQMASPRLSWLDRVRVTSAALHVLGLRQLRSPRMPHGELAKRNGTLHSAARDQQSVRHHYDVPGEFHRLVIGPSMVYSCAYFASSCDTLEDAQARKLDVICRKLRLSPGDRLLDVGCGWGSLILHAARHFGAHAVGVTLSEPQAREARERIRLAGPELAARCEVRVVDYREVSDGPFDAIASVGMYEHVGLDQLDSYAVTIKCLLRPGGLFLNHGIARTSPLDGRPSRFIDRFIFPDGELHPVGELIRALERSGLETRDLESLREHYGLTLRRWIANLHRQREQAVAIAGSERERIWRLYLTGSARAFERGSLSIFQVLSLRAGAPHRLPLAREGACSEARLPRADGVARSYAIVAHPDESA
jgi:cyclopropane-fatty-acyl-phospholipid synthase